MPNNNSNSFATFNPILLSKEDTNQRLKQYYEDNGLTPDNEYMNNYLYSKSNISTQSSPAIEPQQNWNIKDLLNNYNTSQPYSTSDQAIKDITFSIAESEKNKAKTALKFFMNKGLTKEQASGIVGNLHSESGLKTHIFGDGNTSYGIAQWHNERFNNLKNFSKQRGKKVDDFNNQLEFLWSELIGPEKGALNALQLTKSPTEAARVFANKFERMKTYNKERELKANQFYTLD